MQLPEKLQLRAGGRTQRGLHGRPEMRPIAAILRQKLGELRLLRAGRQDRRYQGLQGGQPGRRRHRQAVRRAERLVGLRCLRDLRCQRPGDDSLGGRLGPNRLGRAEAGLEQLVGVGRQARAEQGVIELRSEAHRRGGRRRGGRSAGRCRCGRCGGSADERWCGDLAELAGKRGKRHGAGIPSCLVGQEGDVLLGGGLLEIRQRARVERRHRRRQGFVFAWQSGGVGR